MGSGFMAVNADNYNIQSIVPTFPENAEDPLGNSEAQIQELLTGGTIGVVYHYLVSGKAEKGFDGVGWYTINKSTGNYTKATKTFQPGEGFLYSAPAPYMVDDNDDEIDLPSYLTFQE